MTDPIADLLTRIRNAQTARKNFVTIPYSKVKMEIAKKLQEKRFVEKVEEFTNDTGRKEIVIDLMDRETPLTLTRVSKPGQRIYKKHADLTVVKNGLGIEILSTSKGIKTNTEAHKENLGGEVICRIY